MTKLLIEITGPASEATTADRMAQAEVLVALKPHIAAVLAALAEHQIKGVAEVRFVPQHERKAKAAAAAAGQSEPAPGNGPMVLADHTVGPDGLPQVRPPDQVSLAPRHGTRHRGAEAAE